MYDLWLINLADFTWILIKLLWYICNQNDTSLFFVCDLKYIETCEIYRKCSQNYLCVSSVQIDKRNIEEILLHLKELETILKRSLYSCFTAYQNENRLHNYVLQESAFEGHNVGPCKNAHKNGWRWRGLNSSDLHISCLGLLKPPSYLWFPQMTTTSCEFARSASDFCQ